jgi:cytochrome oxidase Cu insertion factor (SCO1/SenC/PrrC family)
MLKSKNALLILLLVVAMAFGGFLWLRGDQVPQLGKNMVTGQIAVGGPYALTDQDGKPRASTDFGGKYQLIYFGYTFCPDVCPTTLALMAATLDRLGADKDRIVPVFITIDPERDTPDAIKKYVAAFGPQFIGLTGTPDQIAKVEKEFRVYAKKGPVENGTYAMDHSSVMYLMGPDGKLVSFYDEATTPEDLAQQLKSKL